jgi:hypothetical protein
MIKSLRKFIIPLLAAAVLIMLALFADSLYFSNFEYRYRTRLINKILHEKENQMDGLLSSMKPIVASENHHGSETEKDIFSVAARNNITILEYLDNKLTFWSDNDFDVPQAYVDSLYSRPLVFLQNGWFLPEQIESANEKIVGLLRIRADYSLKNDMLQHRPDIRSFALQVDLLVSPVIAHADVRAQSALLPCVLPLFHQDNRLLFRVPLCLLAYTLHYIAQVRPFAHLPQVH